MQVQFAIRSYSMIPFIVSPDNVYVVTKLAISRSYYDVKNDAFRGRLNDYENKILQPALRNFFYESGELFYFTGDLFNGELDDLNGTLIGNEFFFDLRNIPNLEDVIKDFKHNQKLIFDREVRNYTDGIGIVPLFGTIGRGNISTQIQGLRTRHQRQLNRFVQSNRLLQEKKPEQIRLYWNSLKHPEYRCTRKLDQGYIRYELSPHNVGSIVFDDYQWPNEYLHERYVRIFRDLRSRKYLHDRKGFLLLEKLLTFEDGIRNLLNNQERNDFDEFLEFWDYQNTPKSGLVFVSNSEGALQAFVTKINQRIEQRMMRKHRTLAIYAER